MPNYLMGHVKRDPETGEVAIRNYFDEANPQLAKMAWRAAGPRGGSRHLTTAEVEGWDDLYTPIAQEEEVL